MAAKKDYYKILGVDRNADTRMRSRRHIRNWQKKYHPILIRRICLQNEKFKEVTEAYEILHDEENGSCMIDLEQQPLMEVWEQIREDISHTEVLRDISPIGARTAAIRNFILRAEIWMISSGIFSEVILAKGREAVREASTGSAAIAGKERMSPQN